MVYAGQVVEMHGNIRQMVCVKCHTVKPLTAALLRKLKAKKPIPCASCPGNPTMRCRVMLYDDDEGQPEQYHSWPHSLLKCCRTLTLSWKVLVEAL